LYNNRSSSSGLSYLVIAKPVQDTACRVGVEEGQWRPQYAHDHAVVHASGSDHGGPEEQARAQQRNDDDATSKPSIHRQPPADGQARKPSFNQ
jgi:hypothetical protein